MPDPAPPPAAPAAAPTAPSAPPATPADGAVPSKPAAYKSFADAFRQGMAMAPEGDAAGEVVEKPKAKSTPDKNGETPVPAAEEKKARQPFAAEPKAAPDDTPPEVKSEEGKQSWKTWKEAHSKTVKERDSLKAKNAQIESELAKLKSAVPDPARVDELRRENEELNALVRRVRLQDHPEFKSRFDKPLETALARAKQVVPGDKGQIIDVLLRQPWSEGRAAALDELMGELSPSRANALGKAAEDALAAIEARAGALKDEQGFAAQISAHEQAQAQAQQQAAVQYAENIYKQTLGRVLDTDGGLALFQARDGDDEHNTNAQAAIDEAHQLLMGDNRPEQLAEAAFWAAYGKRVHPLLRRAESEIQKLQKQVEKLTAAKPGTPASSSTDGASPKPKSFAAAVREAMTGDR